MIISQIHLIKKFSWLLKKKVYNKGYIKVNLWFNNYIKLIKKIKATRLLKSQIRKKKVIFLLK